MPTLPATITLRGIWAALIALAFAIVLALLAVQTVRIEGFKIWPISMKGYKASLADEKAAHRSCNSNLAVSNASIATLQKSLSDYIGAGKAAKVAQLAAVEAQAKDNAALQGQADAIRAEVAKLPPGKCETPESVRKAKGL